MEVAGVSQTQPNQLRADLLSVCALNPWPGHDSSSRIQMLSNHLGQKLVTAGATERFCQTGMEAEFGKYTLNVKMPVDGCIIKVIDRHKRTVGMDAINHNPETVIIYEDVTTKEIGIITLTEYCSYHPYMGFEYKAKPAMNSLVPGAFIAKDTVFLDSPGVTDNGGYKFGVECNMAFMSHPAVSEDGIMISRDVLHKFKFKTYETRVVEWGAKNFPLNMYGDKDNYKPFPEIGEYVRPDGVLAILRTHDKNLAAVEQSIYDLMEPDYMFDHAVYAPNGKIVDIRVHHEENGNSPTPFGMEKQIEKYDRARRQFYAEILQEWNRLRKARGDALVLSQEFHRLVIEALAATDDSATNKIVKVYRRAPVDDWRVEIVIEHEITPTIGFKLTDCHGGKGVICKIAEPHEMPYDQFGNRTDIVMDANSTISRMNYGRLYEQYYNAASRDVRKRLHEMLGAKIGEKQVYGKLTNLFNDDRAAFDKMYGYLLGYYQAISPRQYKRCAEVNAEQQFDHLAYVLKNNVYLYIPTDNEPESIDIVNTLEQYYRPGLGPVTYIGNSGNTVTTKNNVRIGSLYMMLLEKIGDAWAAVSSGKLQTFGILSQLTKSDKHSQPTRNQAIKAVGETEGRIIVSYAGQEVIAEIMDRNNNPTTHKEIVWGILTAANPATIPELIDRTKTPYGGAKPIQLVSHIAQCAGWEYVYTSKKNSYQTQPQLANLV